MFSIRINRLPCLFQIGYETFHKQLYPINNAISRTSNPGIMSINKTTKLLRYEIMCLKRDGAPILRSFNSIMKLLFKFNDDIISPVVNQRYI